MRFLQKIAIQFLSFFNLILFFCLLSKSAHALNSRSLTVFSEPSTAVALTKIARTFARSHNVVVSINFELSRNSIKKIDDDSPFDVFISANSDAIETLRQKGLVDIYNIAYVASDKLALVTSKLNQELQSNPILAAARTKQIDIKTAIQSINSKKNFLALDYLGYSSGIYADNLLEEISQKNIQLVKKLPEDKSSIIRDLENDKNLFAITFVSQIVNNSNLLVLATDSSRIASYQAMAIAGNNMEIAREFINFLKSEAAHKILQESGYLVN